MLELQLKFKKNSISQIFFGRLKKQKLFVLKKNYEIIYFFFPNTVIFTSFKSNLFFYWSFSKKSKNNIKSFRIFFNKFLALKKNYDKSKKKKLKLNGLGFRMHFSKNVSTLNLKLGYSHFISLQIPTEKVCLTLLKHNVLRIESFNSIFLGVFFKTIYFFKPCDSYKGKGFVFSYKKTKLKPIKKK